MLRPYHPEYTPSRPIREVKLDWAQPTRLSVFSQLFVVQCACQGLGVCNNVGEHCLAVQPFQTHHSRSKQVKALQLQVGCASRFATWAVHYALHLMHGVLQVFVGCFDSQLLGCEELEWIDWHATAIPSRIDPFSSDQGSQAGLGLTSTRLSDRPGTSSADVFVTENSCSAFAPPTYCWAQAAGCLQLNKLCNWCC